MTPLQILCTVLQLAEHFEAKHNRKPTRVLIPARYGRVLGSEFSPVDTVDTLTRIGRVSWVELIDISMNHEMIGVE